jgi:hypothetical protein
LEKKNARDAAPLSLKRRFFRPRTYITLVLALAFLAFVFTRFDVDFSSTWQQVRGSNPLYYSIAVIIYYAAFPLRAWRWKILLRNAGLDKEGKGLPSLGAITQMLLLNWFANVILYARAGDIYRPYLLREDTGIPYSRSLGTVVAERIIDVLIVVVLLAAAVVVLLGGTESDVPLRFMLAGAGFVVLMLVLLALLWVSGGRIERWLPSRLRSMWLSFRQGTFHSFRQVYLPVGVTAAIWLIEVGRLYYVALALGVDIATPWIFFVSLAYALLVAIPVSPGGLGLVEPGMAGLLALTIPSVQAWSVTFLDRTITYLSLIAVGLGIFGWREVRKLLQGRR